MREGGLRSSNSVEFKKVLNTNFYHSSAITD